MLTSATGIHQPPAPSPIGPRRETRRQGSLAGFTLIEMLAVVVIMGAMLALIVPNLGFRKAAALRDQARDLAGQVELARQLAVVTGKPHRLLIDIEAGAYSIERFDKAEESSADDPPEILPGRDYDLSPPESRQLEYRPVENQFARNNELEIDFFFEGLDTGEGWLDSGLVNIVFDSDGTTDPAELVVSDLEGRMVVLEVRPLLVVLTAAHDEVARIQTKAVST